MQITVTSDSVAAAQKKVTERKTTMAMLVRQHSEQQAIYAALGSDIERLTIAEASTIAGLEDLNTFTRKVALYEVPNSWLGTTRRYFDSEKAETLKHLETYAARMNELLEDIRSVLKAKRSEQQACASKMFWLKVQYDALLLQ